MSLPSSKAVNPAATAAAAPPDEPPEVREHPGIVGGTEKNVVALQIAGVDRDVALAKNQAPGILQPLHRIRIGRRHMLRINRRTAGGAQVRGLEAVLDGARQAVQRGTAPPAEDRASAASARLRARSASSVTIALSPGLWRSTRCR